MKTPFESRIHHEIVLFATKMMEVVCVNPWQQNPLLRVWKIAQEVDYNRICLQ